MNRHVLKYFKSKSNDTEKTSDVKLKLGKKSRIEFEYLLNKNVYRVLSNIIEFRQFLAEKSKKLYFS
jgi:hypothetical protein